MADLVITAANVLPGTNARRMSGTAGVTITPGQAVFLHHDGYYYKTDANAGADATTSRAAGIALSGGSLGQPLEVQTGGKITIGAAVTVGNIYVVSATLVGIAPITDQAAERRCRSVRTVAHGGLSAPLRIGVPVSKLSNP
jgi:hypothetical protein